LVYPRKGGGGGGGAGGGTEASRGVHTPHRMDMLILPDRFLIGARSGKAELRRGSLGCSVGVQDGGGTRERKKVKPSLLPCTKDLQIDVFG